MTQEILEFFNGDEMAADVWEKKYKFKDEKTPADSFKRYCKEIAEKEIKRVRQFTLYKEIDDKLSEHGKIRWWKVRQNATCADEKAQEFMEQYFLKYINFENIILGGSMLATIGNHESYSSLSNCFVLGRPYDSYAGINQKTMEMCEVMKRRMGSGIDLSSLRPDGAKVHNQSSESCGPLLFAERYSFISSEIAQRGRRGALMISMSIKHPNAIDFIESKQDIKKLTGANISVILDNEFMKAVENNEYYYQRFPINIPIKDFKFNPLQQSKINELLEVPYYHNGKEGIGYIKIIQAKEVWDKIIQCAWNTAEPGVIFGDNWNDYGTDGVYDRYAAITCNPCSEIPMQAYDSCRLASINLFSFVNKPFTNEAKFDFERFYDSAYEQICILDTIIDMEGDYIDRIINKIQSDKDEPQELKDQTIKLWRKILFEGQTGRRLGAGFTGLGDTLAALGLKYDDSLETQTFLMNLFNKKMGAELDATIDLSVLFGSFDGFDIEKEYEVSGVLHARNKIFNLIDREFSIQLNRMYKFGRHNVSWSTAAPTGSLSILTQTTSGIEPLFLPYYKRRKKCTNHTDRVDYIDPADGQKFTEYLVLHPKFKLWCETIQHLNPSNLSETQLDELFKNSPWYGSCANDIDWKARVQIQSIVQKYTTHSISSTINLPSDIDKETISNIYFESWKKGLKGNTVYRDGCRGGVIVSTNDNKKVDDNDFTENRAPKRPNSLPAYYHTLRYRDKVYSVIIGLMDDKPYEVFIASGLDGMPENFDEFEDKIKGEITKEAKNWYNFECDGFILKDIADAESEERLTSLMLSMALRHRTPLKYVIKTLEKSRPIAGSFTHRLIKILSQYMKESDYDDEKCPECGGKLRHENGCIICSNCGWSKCG